MTDEKKNPIKNSPDDLPDADSKPEANDSSGKKPMRFQFGPDTTEEDIDRFLDMVLRSKPKKKDNHT